MVSNEQSKRPMNYRRNNRLWLRILFDGYLMDRAGKTGGQPNYKLTAHMKVQFDPNQQFQIDAVAAVDLCATRNSSHLVVDSGHMAEDSLHLTVNQETLRAYTIAGSNA